MPLFNYMSKGPSPQQEDTQISRTEFKTDTMKMAKKTYMKKFCRHRKENHQNIHRAILTETFHDEENGIRNVEVGEKSSQNVYEKVVLLIGATGSGKSTLVDAMFNHILGVTWEDDFRLKLTEDDSTSGQSASQTQRITVYTIHHQDWFQMPSTLTIVDTPGLGSTEGMKRDQEIIKQIKTLLQGSGAINQVHGIGFITESTAVRLTSTQTYVFDTIQSIVGKDALENIFLLVTFADANKPPILNAMNSANMKYNKHFSFNCAALYQDMVISLSTCSDDDDDNDDDLDKMLWKRGAKETLSFIKELNNVQPRRFPISENGNLEGDLSAKHAVTEDRKAKLKLERKRSKSLDANDDATDVHTKESGLRKKGNVLEKPKVPEKNVFLGKTTEAEDQKTNGKVESTTTLTSSDTVSRILARRGSCPVSPTCDNNSFTLPVKNKPMRVPELPITTRKLSFLRSQSDSDYTPASPAKAPPYSPGSPSLQTPQGFKPPGPLPDKFSFAKQNKDDSANGGKAMTNAVVSLKRQNARSHSEEESKAEVTNPELDEMLRKIENTVKVSKDKDELKRLVKEARILALNLRDTDKREPQKGTKLEPFTIGEQVMAVLRCEEDDMVKVLNEQMTQLDEAKKNLQFLTEALSAKETDKLVAPSITNGEATPKRVGSRVRAWENRTTKM